jgi:hypothetical protein
MKTVETEVQSSAPEQNKVSFWGELSGSIGDLGTFLPYVLGAISVAGFNPASIFNHFVRLTPFFFLAPVFIWRSGNIDSLQARCVFFYIPAEKK